MSLFARCLAVALLFIQTSAAPLYAQTAVPTDANTARVHFNNGVKLYQDGNYAGALAEFEAAYRNKPSSAALQNVALTQKALFRYAEAADTLSTLLERHTSELSEDERRAVTEAIDELRSLVASVVVQVEPPEARVTIDGRPLEPSERGQSLRLDVGEHTLVAEAPGFARSTYTFRVAAGQRDVPVTLALKPTAGLLEIQTGDEHAAIAIDGKPVAFGQWSGPVSPGSHEVQVYREGFHTSTRSVRVALGETARLRVELTPDSRTPTTPEKRAAAITLVPQRGWYGFLTLGTATVNEVPQGLDPNRAQANGALVALHGGYRLNKILGLELMLQGSRVAGKVCPEEPGTPDPCDDSQDKRDYSLRAVRLGPNARITSAGEVLRFSGAAGIGGVAHFYHQEQVDNFPEIEAQSVDGYFYVEIGGHLNLNHILLGLSLAATFDSIENLRSDVGSGADRFYKADEPVSMVGLAVSGGFSQWRPSKTRKRP